MDAASFRESVESAKATELNRLGSQKLLLALTDAELDRLLDSERVLDSAAGRTRLGAPSMSQRPVKLGFVGLTPVGPVTALSAAIVDHAVKNVVTVAGGVLSTAVLNVSLTTAVDEAREVEEAETSVANVDD